MITKKHMTTYYAHDWNGELIAMNRIDRGWGKKPCWDVIMGFPGRWRVVYTSKLRREALCFIGRLLVPSLFTAGNTA